MVIAKVSKFSVRSFNSSEEALEVVVAKVSKSSVRSFNSGWWGVLAVKIGGGILGFLIFPPIRSIRSSFVSQIVSCYRK